MAKPTKLKPLSPWQTKKELAAIEWLYENEDAKLYTSEWREEQKVKIAERSKLWGKS